MWPAHLAFLFTFLPITLKQLNSLTAINMLSWLGIPEVKHQTFVFVFCFVVVLSLLLCPKHIICHEILQILFNFNSLSILQNLWPIIRGTSYRPSIFKIITPWGFKARTIKYVNMDIQRTQFIMWIIMAFWKPALFVNAVFYSTKPYWSEWMHTYQHNAVVKNVVSKTCFTGGRNEKQHNTFPFKIYRSLLPSLS